MSCSAAVVPSSGVPAGMSTTTWYSLLLSKGSIFSTTPTNELGTSARLTDSSSAPPMPAASSQRFLALCSSGVRVRVNVLCSVRVILPGPCAAWPSPVFVSLSASQGVTVKAMASEIAMPMLALIGIGLMYGPIRPLTKAMGSSAAITVKVARMVGPPTSSTARGMITESGTSGVSMRWR
ncbi:hypothetical protein FQZ97_673430 [compost metagenome]